MTTHFSNRFYVEEIIHVVFEGLGHNKIRNNNSKQLIMFILFIAFCLRSVVHFFFLFLMELLFCIFIYGHLYDKEGVSTAYFLIVLRPLVVKEKS